MLLSNGGNATTGEPHQRRNKLIKNHGQKFRLRLIKALAKRQMHSLIPESHRLITRKGTSRFLA